MPEPGAPPAAKPDSTEKILEILGASDDPAELPHVEWRRRLHRFCENWIFALIIAFGIRHFCIELFRIPSASMEPMLLGDPGFGKGDFVLVDKLSPRWRDVQRWDVAVFQYPVREVESPTGGRARPAESAEGRRLDDPLWNPLLGSNFVKRVVLMPGDRFYIMGGEVFLRDGAGWTIPRKPDALQEHLWLPIYAAGAQPAYRPWTASGGATADAQGDLWTFALAGGAVAFDQPLRNVYLKDGAVAVRRAGSQDAFVRVDGVGLTTPMFAWGDGRHGTIWQLDTWEIKRLTSADQDDPGRGTQINQLMQEWTGDLRVGARVESLDGEAGLVLANRALGAAAPERTITLTLHPAGWRLAGTGLAAGLQAEGRDIPVGHRVDLAHIDGQVLVRIDGAVVARHAVAWADPNGLRPSLAWTGGGRIALRGLTVERDLHYTTKGFLAEAPMAGDPDGALEALQQKREVPAGEPRDNQYASWVRMPRAVRAQILGMEPDQLRPREAVKAYGNGPDNPATAPDGAYLMLGDNSPHSLDGRDWGWVPRENLRGRGWLIVFPPNRWKVIR